MNADIFQAALSATARIACCAVLVSCQKTPETPTPPMKEHAEQQAEQPTEKQQTAPKETATKKSETVEASNQPKTECDPMIEEYFQARQGDPSVEVSEELDKCCVDLLSDIKKKIEAQPRGEFEPLPNILHDDCCMITNYRTAGCTPWGPPMPPTLV